MTTAAKATFDKKSIYHSDLIRAASGSGVMLKIKGDPRESKYKKPGTSHFAVLQFPDDEQDYLLAVEDTTLDMFRRAPKDVWVMASPAGSATEPATITFHEAEGHPVYHKEEDAKPQDGPPPMWPEDEKPAPSNGSQPVEPHIVYDPIDLAVSATVKAVKALKEAGIDVDPTPIYSTHYIQASRR